MSLRADGVFCSLPLFACLACGVTPRADMQQAGAETGPNAASTSTGGTMAAGTDAYESTGGTAAQSDPESRTESSTSQTLPDPFYDVGSLDLGAAVGEGCRKIDFLFVVDNSLSMALHQTALINSFGGFIETITAEVQGDDFHILVTDSDAGDDVILCGTCLFCGDYCDQTFDACETELGAGEIQPYGGGASNAVCGVPGPHRYLTSTVPTPQLADTFACMAQVGTSGSGAELPMSAAVQALTAQSARAGCNAGFRRPDAILVVTIISDDPYQSQTSDNASTVGSPEEWYDGIMTAAGDDPASVVMLGVVQTAENAPPRFDAFFDLFGDRALRGDINAPAYDEFFDTAVDLIDVTCDEFQPEG